MATSVDLATPSTKPRAQAKWIPDQVRNDGVAVDMLLRCE